MHLTNKKMMAMALSAVCLLALAACGPNEQRRAELAELKRIECLDKFCAGDIEPKRDYATDALLKFNGQWYIGPKEYFSSGINGASFNWWAHQPSPLSKLSPEIQAKAVEHNVAIFLRGKHRWPDPKSTSPWSRTWEQAIESKRAEGKYIEQEVLGPGLDEYRQFRTKGGNLETIYYAATQRKRIRGDGPPIAFCLNEPPGHYSNCAAAEFWQPDIYADFQFSAKDAKDWPEIHQEIIRVLNLLQKVQP